LKQFLIMAFLDEICKFNCTSLFFAHFLSKIHFLLMFLLYNAT
jgi:hypothetical protein